MTTIAQAFIQEGIEKGLEQGRLEAKQEIERITRKLLWWVIKVTAELSRPVSVLTCR